MFKKKCPSCAKKIDRKFNYCPYCGKSIKTHYEKENFGMLGREDVADNNLVSEIKLPLGLNKIMNSLMKQIEKEMSQMDSVEGMPKGFKIQIKTGMPQQIRQVIPDKKIINEPISDEENERRKNLKKVEASSKVRRIGDKIVYEISTPGVKLKKDVVVTKLESGIEIRAYSKNKCYVKTIPLEVEIARYYIEDERLFVELKG